LLNRAPELSVCQGRRDRQAGTLRTFFAAFAHYFGARAQNRHIIAIPLMLIVVHTRTNHLV